MKTKLQFLSAVLWLGGTLALGASVGVDIYERWLSKHNWDAATEQEAARADASAQD